MDPKVGLPGLEGIYQGGPAVGFPVSGSKAASRFGNQLDPARGPAYLGATVGRAPIAVCCAACGVPGMTEVRRGLGPTAAIAGGMTLGLGLCLDFVWDARHHCSNCDAYLAVSKLM